MSGGYVTGRLCEVCGNASPPEAVRAGIRAVAERVRRACPPCLIARAVALGCDVRLLRNTIDTSLWSLTVGGEAGTRHLTAARAAGYAEGRAAERADMLAFVADACRLGTQGDALLRALMAKGKHEGAASIVAKKGTP